MCTSIILFRKAATWPIIIGSNRDENLNRKSSFPGKHWKKNYPNVIGGKDLKKKGSWIGINNNGLVALIHNRISNKKKSNFRFSRGKIVLEVLNSLNINKALKFISTINPKDYDYFNLFIANHKNCYFIKHNIITRNLQIHKIKEGLTIMTDKDINDKRDKKIIYYHKLFSSLKIPNPSKNNWDSWKKNLSYNNEEKLPNNQRICSINKKLNYGTRSSCLIALPNLKNKKKIIFKSTKSVPKIDNYIDVNMK
ncbi:MAG: hypothetical protein CFH16_00692 [Alphaproteobacteria bacterium MarineAlpha5_Bin6]|nr:MAG: hypothetical protein CFH17_00258 [Alphaproteobacteria bacterium MarineAlpha5_Bin7]PPR53999.1 MAG: hypothetical protein CFH16_00692 [Alphaproteobacteria bacterium MarineAlpha5_Bin6]|tara:strand:- start:813 stop:1568 length:756 start_codon:yes stop_codon:yes gene_type:complete